MWLSHIHATKVAEDVRPKLLALQLDAKASLLNHFFGFINKRAAARQLETAHKVIRRFETGVGRFEGKLESERRHTYASLHPNLLVSLD